MQAPDFAQPTTSPRPTDTNRGIDEVDDSLQQVISNHLRNEFLAMSKSHTQEERQSKSNEKKHKDEKIDISKCEGSE